ncbi:GNAT family N-acetyltransferase [Bacillus sp. BHET2]|nr:GNAT family N-acetyltransferase [Bacillus sp. BHET2]
MGLRWGIIFVGCLGIEFLDDERCELKHIAVMPTHRSEGIGNENARIYHSPSFITAEITGLGENYPEVERFYCVLEKPCCQ